jgi:hypothetical protein
MLETESKAVLTLERSFHAPSLGAPGAGTGPSTFDSIPLSSHQIIMDVRFLMMQQWANIFFSYDDLKYRYIASTGTRGTATLTRCLP